MRPIKPYDWVTILLLEVLENDVVFKIASQGMSRDTGTFKIPGIDLRIKSYHGPRWSTNPNLLNVKGYYHERDSTQIKVPIDTFEQIILPGVEILNSMNGHTPTLIARGKKHEPGNTI